MLGTRHLRRWLRPYREASDRIHRRRRHLPRRGNVGQYTLLHPYLEKVGQAMSTSVALFVGGYSAEIIGGQCQHGYGNGGSPIVISGDSRGVHGSFRGGRFSMETDRPTTISNVVRRTLRFTRSGGHRIHPPMRWTFKAAISIISVLESPMEQAPTAGRFT